MHASTGPNLLEREHELGQLADGLRRAVGGKGAMVLVEGPAGIGKTALLNAARRAARRGGMRVLSATASRLESDFPFGVVHQLLGRVAAERDEDGRAQLFGGAAHLAEGLLTGRAVGDIDGQQELSFGILHGLYWTLANLADEAPVVVVVDDLQWADGASLRLLEFLARRLDGLSLVVVGGLRTGEPNAHVDLLEALGATSSCRVVHPQALSVDAAAVLVERRLSAPPDRDFAEACTGTTGGNPLLLGLLMDIAGDHGLRGCADERERLVALGAVGAAGHVRRRIAALGDDAMVVASAAAVAGARATTADLATLTGLESRRTGFAVTALVEAGVLADEGTSFVHPLVREAVVELINPDERARLHRVAARCRADAGARAEEVATHLLASAPDDDPWVTRVLREAALAVAAAGEPADGARMLRRARRQSLSPTEGAELHLELGELLVAAGDGDAESVLREALDAGLGEPDVARARYAIGRARLTHDPEGAFHVLHGLIGHPHLGERAEALALDATFGDLRLQAQRRDLLRPPGARSLARRTHAAIDAIFAGTPRTESQAHLQSAIADGDFVARMGPDAPAVNLLVQSARVAELSDTASAMLVEQERVAARHGSLVASVFVEQARAYWQWYFGTVAAAETHAQEGLRRAAAGGLGIAQIALTAVSCELLVERGRLDGAQAALDDFEQSSDAFELTFPGSDLLVARGRLRRLRDDRVGAIADFRRAHAMNVERGWRTPLKTRAALRLADALIDAGETEEARDLTAQAADVARRAGLAGALGMTRRTEAPLEQDPRAALEEAVRHLRASPLQLELGWTLLALGQRLRQDGQLVDAREPLREALDIATRTGGDLLNTSARDELVAAGGRPRRRARSGPEALTPSERRVAEFAARGLTNRQIAETLWVTAKTVEVHLSSTYKKLGVSSRKQLAAAMG